MAWLVILSSIVVLWVASLCKILHGSLFSSKVTFLNDGGVTRRRNVLLVIAHPDDESMFFAPTINHLISEGHNLHVLCMSTGDAEGQGNIRKEELYLASAILRIPVQQVKIVDHPDLQDGFGKMWNWNLLANIIDEETRAHSIDLIITFDDYGVSGHCNHHDVHQGVRKLLSNTSGRHIEVWELVSIGIARKYSGTVDIWLSIVFSRCQQNGQSQCLLNQYPLKSYSAMAQHSSQWVWLVLLNSFTSNYFWKKRMESGYVSCFFPFLVCGYWFRYNITSCETVVVFVFAGSERFLYYFLAIHMLTRSRDSTSSWTWKFQTDQLSQ